MKTRVAIIIYEIDTPAGMQRQAALLVSRLVRRGFDVRIISTVAPRNLLSRAGRPVEGLPDVPVVRIPTTRTPMFELAARAWLARRGGADVLYGIGWHAGVHAAGIAARTRTPIVLKYAASGQLGDFAQLSGRPAARACLDAVARHVCISAEIRKEVLAAGIPAEKVVSIPNGVDPDGWSVGEEPAPLPWTDGRVVLFIGRLCRQKRVDVLLDAFARVAPDLPDVRLAVIGDGPLRAVLETQTAALSLGETVAFLGVRHDVPALHRTASLLVLPSEGEGMPNVVLEAFAAGTLVVATDVTGITDIARADREALLVPPGDPDALASAILRALTDPELAGRLTDAGRARVRDAFDIDLIADRYTALFTDIAHTGAGS